jgi:hypothetical protein
MVVHMKNEPFFQDSNSSRRSLVLADAIILFARDLMSRDLAQATQTACTS